MENNPKIFGIGLSKTGLTSLTKALQMLGFRGSQYIADPKYLDKKLKTADFIVDMPIPTRYKELDKKYPNSKFILTVRDEKDWIASCQKWWTRTKIPKKKSLQAARRIEQYGRTDFDAETFINLKRDHEEEVKEYFKDRPNDLLIINISKGEGWKELCAFLRKPLPNKKFPKENVTEDNINGKRSLIVTVANEDYIDQAKQLFSSVYYNGGWTDDYMLLAHDIPEKKLKWFKEKGILVKRCKPLYHETFGKKMHPVVTSKFYLFTPEFKKWKTVVYLDSDIIVKTCLEKLKHEKRFAAVADAQSMNLKQQFVREDKQSNQTLLKKLKKNYNLQRLAFNSGVMVINTAIIDDNSFHEILRLADEYEGVNGDQRVFNLLLYKRWNRLPSMYNVYTYAASGCFIFRYKLKAILHFIGEKKPWHKNNPYYKEWNKNLLLAEKINIRRPIKQQHITNKKIKQISRSILLRYRLFAPLLYIDQRIGKLSQNIIKTKR